MDHLVQEELDGSYCRRNYKVFKISGARNKVSQFLLLYASVFHYINNIMMRNLFNDAFSIESITRHHSVKLF